MSNRIVVALIIACLLLFFAAGFIVGRMQHTNDQSRGSTLSPEVTSAEMEQIVAKIRTDDLGMQVSARVAYVYSLPVEKSVERWTVSGSFFWGPVADGHSRMRTKFFLVALRDGDEWGSTDWNISTAEPLALLMKKNECVAAKFATVRSVPSVAAILVASQLRPIPSTPPRLR